MQSGDRRQSERTGSVRQGPFSGRDRIIIDAKPTTVLPPSEWQFEFPLFYGVHKDVILLWYIHVCMMDYNLAVNYKRRLLTLTNLKS